MAVGLYISVPFCPTKCSYCNFASGVFSSELFSRYLDRLCADLERAPGTAAEMGGVFDRRADSLYVGGGTPSLLPPDELRRLFSAVRGTFDLDPRAEITVECAPGTLTAATVAALRECGVNRVSLGVQSMFDREAAAVGRRHTRAVVLEDIARLRAAGIANINIDLIAGLPHQTAASWRESIDAVLVTGVPHVSVYMLEVDGDSRLGRELIAGGARYHAHFVPNEDATADFYVQACAQLEQTGVRQYEISNFARSGFESIHNLKYWTRRPYLGFGLDAHSMLPVAASHQPVSVSAAGGLVLESVRFSTPDSLDAFLAAGPLKRTAINRNSAREEAFFLGLRLNRGVDLKEIACEFGSDMNLQDAVAGLVAENLLDRQGGVIRLTDKGRLLSNEVFERFLAPVPTIAE